MAYLIHVAGIIVLIKVDMIRRFMVCVHGRLSRLPNISTHMIATTSLDGAIQRAAHFSNVEPWIDRATIDFQI